MSYRSKYTTEQTQQWTVEAMVTLAESREAMTNEQIRSSNLTLAKLTPQKMTRILSDLTERGLVLRSKGKDGLMKYKSVGVLLEQGYDLNKMVY